MINKYFSIDFDEKMLHLSILCNITMHFGTFIQEFHVRLVIMNNK